MFEVVRASVCTPEGRGFDSKSKAHTGVVGSLPAHLIGAWVGGNQSTFLSHIDVSPLFLPSPLPLSLPFSLKSNGGEREDISSGED